MSNEHRPMNAKEQMTLERYKDLSSWNDRDKQTIVSFDRLFLPVTIGAWALSLAKYDEYFIHVYIGSLLLLTFWMLLSWRYWERMSDRFRIMNKIECGLGFQTHGKLSDNLASLRDIELRWWFYSITMVLGAVVAVITPYKLKPILDCSLWNRLMVLILVLLLITLIALLIKFLPSLYKKLLKTVGKG